MLLIYSLLDLNSLDFVRIAFKVSVRNQLVERNTFFSVYVTTSVSCVITLYDTNSGNEFKPKQVSVDMDSYDVDTQFSIKRL